MKKIKIGVMNDEKEYVLNLIAFLQKYGKEKWELSAFTKEESLKVYLKERTLDLLVATDKSVLANVVEENYLLKVWLTDEKNQEREDIGQWYSIYRFQSASEIGKRIDEIINREINSVWISQSLVAVYSPVGRCGKTTLALEVVKSERYGKWLYFGMEDYSSFYRSQNGEEDVADELLYYWKEQKVEKFLVELEQIEDVIVTGTSFFDSKKIEIQDMNWLKKTLEQSGYRGVIFDIGSGTLQDFQMFKVFDYIIVPYVEEERARIKKENFETLFSLQGMENCEERLVFVDMDKKAEISAVMEKIFGGERK